MKTYKQYIQEAEEHYKSILIRYAAPTWAKPPHTPYNDGELVLKTSTEEPRSTDNYLKVLEETGAM